jgi:radial spoke head protein 3
MWHRVFFLQGHQDDIFQPANIMFDRRVVRGNTYAAQILPAEAPMHSPASPVKLRRRKPAARKPATPPPVQGRQHIELQTDAYLEELTDVVPDKNAITQTDAFLERPITPLFIPQKRGVDAETQIDNGDLFDFNLEVEPLLEVLVGKTLEQGLMEVQSYPPDVNRTWYQGWYEVRLWIVVL